MEPDWEFISRQMGQNFAVAIEDGIKNGLPDAKERRIALIAQIAAVIGGWPFGSSSYADDVQAARKYLAEAELSEPK